MVYTLRKVMSIPAIFMSPPSPPPPPPPRVAILWFNFVLGSKFFPLFQTHYHTLRTML